MTIADNKKAFHDYFIEERFEAGMALEGWEVKSIRAGRVQLKEAYVIVKGVEFFSSARTSARYRRLRPISSPIPSATENC